MSMADDREILRTIWDGRIPVCFRLNSEEVHTLNVPEPFYLMVPRCMYFPLVIDKVRKHFLQYINPESNNKDMWLEYNSQSIKWNYPIGVLFDYYKYSSGDLLDKLVLPWTLVVHFESYPESQILRLPTGQLKETLKAHFMSSLKEADALKHNSKVINSMQEKEHNQLWNGFINDRFDQFWGINTKLMEPDTGASNYKGFRLIPIRFYVPGTFKLMQKLIKPFDELTNNWVTLEELLIEFGFDHQKSQIIAHGIEMPLITPVQWMAEHLSYPDNFLHLILVPTSEAKDMSSRGGHQGGQPERTVTCQKCGLSLPERDIAREMSCTRGHVKCRRCYSNEPQGCSLCPQPQTQQSNKESRTKYLHVQSIVY